MRLLPPSLPIPHFAFCILISTFCLLLSSCANPPTPYQPISRDGGYTQSKTGPNSYLVGFTGNPSTPYPRAYDFALLRAAQIGQQLSYSWFVVEGQADNSQRQVLQGPTTSQTFGTTVGPYGGTFIGTTTTFPNQQTEFRPGVQLTVTYYNDQPTGHFLANSVFNIAETIPSLQAKYGLNASYAPIAPGNSTSNG
jgi:hypothetical protein